MALGVAGWKGFQKAVEGGPLRLSLGTWSISWPSQSLPSPSCCQAGWVSAVTPSRKGQGHSSQDGGGTVQSRNGAPCWCKSGTAPLPSRAWLGVSEPTRHRIPAQRMDACGSGKPHDGPLLQEPEGGNPWLRADAADVSVPMSLACFLLMKCLKPGLAYGRCPRGRGCE